MSVEAPVFHIVSDIDNVQGLTVGKILQWSNTWVNRNARANQALTEHDYREDFHRMWGVSLEEGNNRWSEFCSQHMKDIPPEPEMQRVIAGLPVNVVIDDLTSRASHTNEVTSQWVRTHYPRVGKVLHALTDWTNDPHAHKKTKAASLSKFISVGTLASLPDMIVDDEPKHVAGCMEIGIEHCVLYGNYPWNRHAQSTEGVVWLPTASLLQEYVEEAVELKETRVA